MVLMVNYRYYIIGDNMDMDMVKVSWKWISLKYIR